MESPDTRAAEPPLCAHPDCRCVEPGTIERDGFFYCSDGCARTEPNGGPCDCGHTGCGGDADLNDLDEGA